MWNGTCRLGRTPPNTSKHTKLKRDLTTTFALYKRNLATAGEGTYVSSWPGRLSSLIPARSLPSSTNDQDREKEHAQPGDQVVGSATNMTFT